MKIQQSDTLVETNLQSKQSFTIVANAKAFSILSSSLYSNKIGAIIRELSTNARDSHIDANNLNTPFDVQLPNSLESVFSVRDYGTGMSHENVMRLYTTYFDSTKTHSNDYIGALGLGSKSPFSYTQTFSVVSWYNGFESVYLCYLDKGYPNISFVSKKESSEPSGIKVSFTVDTADIYSFMINAKNIFTYFDNPLPKINGRSDVEIVQKEMISVDIFPPDIYYSPSNVTCGFVKQGCIGYPISLTSLTNDTLEFIDFTFTQSEEIKKTCINLFVANYLCIDASIGEFDIAASREALSYEDQTFISFGKYISSFFNTMYDYIKKQYDSCGMVVDFIKCIVANTNMPKNLITTLLEQFYKIVRLDFCYNGNSSKLLSSINIDFNKLFKTPVYTHVFYTNKNRTIRKKSCVMSSSVNNEIVFDPSQVLFVYYDKSVSFTKNVNYVRGSKFLSKISNIVNVIPIDFVDKIDKIFNVVPAHMLEQIDKLPKIKDEATSSFDRSVVSYYMYRGHTYSVLDKKTTSISGLDGILEYYKKQTAQIFYTTLSRVDKTWRPGFLCANYEGGKMNHYVKHLPINVFVKHFEKVKNFTDGNTNPFFKMYTNSVVFLIKPQQVELLKANGGIDIIDIQKNLLSFAHTTFNSYFKYNVTNSFDSDVVSLLQKVNDDNLQNSDLYKAMRCFGKVNNRFEKVKNNYAVNLEMLKLFFDNTYNFEKYISDIKKQHVSNIYQKVLSPTYTKLEQKYPLVFSCKDIVKRGISVYYINDMRKYIVDKNSNIY